MHCLSTRHLRGDGQRHAQLWSLTPTSHWQGDCLMEQDTGAKRGGGIGRLTACGVHYVADCVTEINIISTSTSTSTSICSSAHTEHLQRRSSSDGVGIHHCRSSPELAGVEIVGSSRRTLWIIVQLAKEALRLLVLANLSELESDGSCRKRGRMPHVMPSLFEPGAVLPSSHVYEARGVRHNRHVKAGIRMQRGQSLLTWAIRRGSRRLLGLQRKACTSLPRGHKLPTCWSTSAKSKRSRHTIPSHQSLP